MDIRKLKANEIEARVQIVKEEGCSLLLYIDARAGMNILDEVFGVTGWQRKHKLINGNLFCDIEIWDKDKECWVCKEDVGTESYTEKEKGQASDAFKRACVNVGIGRELYTAPFIWVKLNKQETYKNGKDKYGNDKFAVKSQVKFSVQSIEYNDNREIIGLTIKDNYGNIRYTLNGKVEDLKSNKKNNSNKPKPQTISESKKSDKNTNSNITKEQQLIIDTCESSETARDIRDNFLKMISVESVDKLDIGQTKALMNKIGISGK